VPAFAVWYEDSTITGNFWSAYRPRAAGAHPGDDRFFRYDSTAVRWIEVTHDASALDSARAANPQWREDHRALAGLFARAEDWGAAASEFALLHAAHPESLDFAISAAVAAEVAEDSARAARFYDWVASHAAPQSNDAAFARGFAERWRARHRGP
jgi:hypothetical protein